MTRIAIIQDKPRSRLQQDLADYPIEVAAVLDVSQAQALINQSHVLDAVIIDVQGVNQGMRNFLRELKGKVVCPFIVFSREPDLDIVNELVSLGIAAYIVDEPNPARLETIIKVAKARYTHFCQLEQELDKLKQDLSNRKIIERAKGILMQQHQLSEDQAYSLLRKRAMEKSRKLVEVAGSIVEAAEMLKSL